MIEIKNLSKSFGEKNVLKDISISFEKGKTNLIIGKSGSGKSVLLKSIVGLHPIDCGDIYFGEMNFLNLNVKEKKHLRQEMGMLFQGGALFDSATVEQNIMFPLDMFSDMNAKEKKKRVDFCLERVNIENSNHLYPAEISGGMQKRVAIARAIVLNPKYLFCDEPNSGLDPSTSIVIDNLIKELTVEYEMTTVVITHDMNSVIEIGDAITFLHMGNKWWQGTRHEIFSTENQELNDFVFPSELMKKIKRGE